ncbi:MAG: hypothetical protein R2706_06455 [Acidimicrobiales bacterium]
MGVALGDDLDPEVQAANYVQTPLTRHLAGSGESGPVAVSMEILSADGWYEIQCGSAKMLFASELPWRARLSLLMAFP